MAEIHKVQSGDCAWNFTREIFEKKLNRKISNQEVANYLNTVYKAYNCSSIDDFSKKYFILGKEFEVKDSIFNNIPEVQNNNSPEPIKNEDYIAQIEPEKQDAIDNTHKPSQTNPITTVVPDYSISKPWSSIVASQNKINNLPTDKAKIITYQRELNESRDNYIIVDKKNYSATVYSWDGKAIKSYEIGVAKEKSDALLKRSYKTTDGHIISTTAGIYTANYRATGRDAYKKYYNDRILTLSNDSLREKGVGNGETGVALHQVPNGNKDRAEKLKRAGVSDENNRFSSGCINFLPEDFDDCMKNIAGVGTKVFILPEDSNNYFTVKNGKLHYAQRKYTGDVPTTSTKNDPVMKISISAKNSNMRQEGKDMAAYLASQKHSLSRELGLDNDTYNELAMLVLGMAGQETQWGKPTAGINIFKGHCSYWIKENAEWLVNTLKWLKGNRSYNSRGINQIKIEGYIGDKAVNQEVKNLMLRHGITKDNLTDPKKSAVATMILLSSIYKDELPALRDQMEKLNMSKMDAVLYCYSNHKNEIKNGTATPDRNNYVKNVKKCADEFILNQYDITTAEAQERTRNKANKNKRVALSA